LSGWAIETNSIYNIGIDEIEIFLDGKPGKGKYLGKTTTPHYEINNETVKFLENLFMQFYNRKPSEKELNYWAINLELKILPLQDVALNIIDSEEFTNKNLSNEYFIKVLYRGLLNREGDDDGIKTWTKLLNSGASNRYEILNGFLNSVEFKSRSDEYYKAVTLRQELLNIMKKDVGAKYGEQFYFSGFNISFDSTIQKNGAHKLYIYVHSPVFGWGYKEVNFFIEN